MKIWIDLGNSPHVPFFAALAPEFERAGHRLVWTARDYAQTVALAERAGLPVEVFGTHGGKGLFGKGVKFAGRVGSLTRWARKERPELVVSHNSHEPLAVARLLGIDSVNLMDYEHHPMNRLSFRLARRVIVPESFPEETLRELNATHKTKRFAGIKEDVYLSGFAPDPAFRDELAAIGVEPGNLLVIVRPHAPEALYHRGIGNDLLDKLIDRLAADAQTRLILLPRKTYQGDELRARHPQSNVIIPNGVLDGANLLAASDYVISGGGTMNREAAALGVPTATIFAGRPAAIDDYLARTGRLLRIESEKDLDQIVVVKKPERNPRFADSTRTSVARMILGEDS